MRPHLFLLILLLGQLNAAPSFLLPDEASDAVYALKKEITSAKASIVLITPRLHHQSLRNALVKAIKKGVDITLISAGGDDLEYLVQFNALQGRTIQALQSDGFAGNIRLTLLIIDNQTACYTSVPLTRQSLKHDTGILECHDDAENISRYKSYTDTLISRSEPYLQ